MRSLRLVSSHQEQKLYASKPKELRFESLVCAKKPTEMVGFLVPKKIGSPKEFKLGTNNPQRTYFLAMSLAPTVVLDHLLAQLLVVRTVDGEPGGVPALHAPDATTKSVGVHLDLVADAPELLCGVAQAFDGVEIGQRGLCLLQYGAVFDGAFLHDSSMRGART